MNEAFLSDIFRYPVKSMMGEPLAQATVTESGLVGDRAWAVRDEKRGGIRGGKKIPALMKLSAVTAGDGPMITAPDGETSSAAAAEIHDWLSKKLSHPVSLWPLLPADQLDHYRRGAPDEEDFEKELRSVFGRLPGEPLPDLAPFMEVLEFESPPGTYFDAFPLMLMSQQSLTTMSKANPDCEFDVRRFRPNLLLDFPADNHPFPEQQWVGKTVAVGDVVLEISSTCPRCSMVTQPFSDLPKDPAIMRALVQQAEGNLGVYARIRTAGEISRGDPANAA
jgi:uncharacterized protein YcbX